VGFRTLRVRPTSTAGWLSHAVSLGTPQPAKGRPFSASWFARGVVWGLRARRVMSNHLSSSVASRFELIVACAAATLGCQNGLVSESPASGGHANAATGGNVTTQAPAGGRNAASTSSSALSTAGGSDAAATGGAASVATEPSGGAAPTTTQTTGGAAGLPGTGVNPSRRSYVLYDVNATGMSRDIFLKSVDGQCNHAVVGTDAQEKQPSVSSDGCWLAYASDATGTYQIHVMELATGAVSVMTDLAGGATYPSWSPDSSQIVFMTGDGETNAAVRGDVMLLDVATRQTRLLYAGTNGICCVGYRSPVFASSDLVLVANGVSLLAVHVADATWYDVVPFTPRLPNPQDPAPSPDGKLVVFSDYCGGQLQLYVARVDGSTGDTCSAALPLAKHTAGLVSPSWGPDGLVVAETRDANLVLLRADGTGTVDTFVDVPGPAHNPTFAPNLVDPECP
jgi:hypothetical protein